ncbi:hypothetical protein POM88_050050 [Heracleum sosnowskyi]|uniref:Uncharacterized protein n=1 Tax=Heracleum sosnowskyi TaxID=360622 RepID=A0AAD8M1Z6_9APIA|nr:hypothetical protein POM88_050050 [Heracleum sosnowskyi]
MWEPNMVSRIQGFEEMASLILLDLGGCNSYFLSNTFTKRLFQIFSGFGHQIEIYIPSSEFPDWINQSSDLGSTMCLDLSPIVSDNMLSASMDSISQLSDSGPTVPVPLYLSTDESDNNLEAESTDSIRHSSDSGSENSLDSVSQSSDSGSENSLDSNSQSSDSGSENSLDSISQSSDSGSTISSDLACQKIQWSIDLPPNVSHNFLGMILCFNYPVDKFYIIEYSIENTTSGFRLSDSLYNSHNTESLMVIVPRSIFSVSDGDHRVELTANIEIHGIHLLYKTELQ